MVWHVITPNLPCDQFASSLIYLNQGKIRQFIGSVRVVSYDWCYPIVATSRFRWALSSNQSRFNYKNILKSSLSTIYLRCEISSHNSQSKSIMSSDEAYESFLDQANQDTGAGKNSERSGSATAKAIDTDVPVSLQKVEQYYTSEADEPFEPVSLSWSGSNMPSESTSVLVAFSFPFRHKLCKPW